MKSKLENNKVDKLFNFILQKKYGDIIYHKDIENVLELSRELRAYSGYLRMTKTRLIPKSLVLKAIPGIGYQILKPNQISSYTYRQYIKRTLNLYNYSELILDYVNTEALTNDRLQEYKDVKELNKKIKEMSQKTIKESKYYSRKDYYDSLEE